MIFPEKVIKQARITEKATALSAEHNQYTFEVFPTVNRTQVKQAIEKKFSVKVDRVNIVNRKGKSKRSRTRSGIVGQTSQIKKAVVTLKEGHKIELI